MANVVQSNNSLVPKYKKNRNLAIIFYLICFGAWLLWMPSHGNFLIIIPFFGGALAGGYFTKQAKILKSGIQGEQSTKAIFSTLPDNCTVISDLAITVEGKQSQIDHVVVCPTGIFVIEVKNMNGYIEGTSEDRQLTQHKTGRKGGEYSKTLYNPVKQVGTHVYRLKTLLRENGVNAWVQGIVFFSNPAATVMIHNNGNIPVFSAGEHGDKEMLEFITGYDKAVDSSAQNKVIDLLKSYLYARTSA